MTSKSILNCERDSIQKFEKYHLPHGFKKIGLVIAIGSFIGLFANKATLDSLLIREVVKVGMLVGLLIVSISKEKIEDELIVKIRMQSYAIAFIGGVILSLFQPFANYLVDVVLGAENPAFTPTGDFQILWILLSIQVMYFELFKRIA